MRKTIYSIATAALLVFAAPASADVAQAWNCTLNDEFTGDWLDEGTTPGDALSAISAEYLAAVREVNEDASIKVYSPVVGADDGDTYVFVLYLPSFAAWGAFMEAYPDSAAAEVDSRWDDIGPCDTSKLWWGDDFEGDD